MNTIFRIFLAECYLAATAKNSFLFFIVPMLLQTPYIEIDSVT